jgi:hypothetical protein
MTSKAIPLPDLAGFTERNGNWYAEEIPLVDLAKEFAINNELYKSFYKQNFDKSYNFCKEFRVPIKAMKP